jgi:hypothetical protein
MHQRIAQLNVLYGFLRGSQHATCNGDVVEVLVQLLPPLHIKLHRDISDETT